MDDDLSDLVREVMYAIADGFGVPEETVPLEVQQAVTRALYTAHRRAIRRRHKSSATAIPVIKPPGDDDDGS